MKTINCKGKLIDLSHPKVMGIVNVTPDSFYDGGKLKTDNDILFQVEKMLLDEATFIDLGGYSSRPSADDVSENEELNRVLPAIELILKNFPETLISIDTFRSAVAKKSVETGAAIINDISAGFLDEQMMDIAAQLQVPYLMMHMRGNPKTMQSLTDYKNVVQEVLFYFSERIATARKKGINDLIIDPGFGFSKTTEQNYEVLSNLELFQKNELPVLVGLSRKSMIYKMLKTSSKESLTGTISLNTIALLKGASILRVHDVKEAVECIKLVENLT